MKKSDLIIILTEILNNVRPYTLSDILVNMVVNKKYDKPQDFILSFLIEFLNDYYHDYQTIGIYNSADGDVHDRLDCNGIYQGEIKPNTTYFFIDIDRFNINKYREILSVKNLKADTELKQGTYEGHTYDLYEITD